MSSELRDEFATAALTGFLAEHAHVGLSAIYRVAGTPPHTPLADAIAVACYAVADAMLKERARP